MMMKLPLGTDNFRVLRENEKYYVDKTLLIKEFLDYGLEGTLITRPRRFGKTLNMTMLREFFDITKESKSLFSGMKIMETEYAHKINSTPVIYLTFKNCDASNQDDLLIAIAKEIAYEYERLNEYFDGGINQDKLAFMGFQSTLEMFKNTFKTSYKGEEEKKKVDEGILKSSLEVLIRAVHLFTGIKPIVLIDEYDQPIISAHENGYRESFSNIYAGLLTEGLKSNEHLGQALMTGIQRVAKESIFSKLNHFVVYTVLDEKYSDYFGLTTDEARQTLIDFGLELNEEVKNYYDGYRFGQRDIYNPWSIFSYIDKKELQPYWRNTSTNGLIKEAIASANHGFFESFEELILNRAAEVDLNLEASFVELATTETLWGLLVNSGYLTISADDKDMVRIPNLEAMKEFREIVATYTHIGTNQLEKLFKALMKKDMTRFLKHYQKVVYQCTSYYDVKENAYHMLLLGMSISVSGMYTIKSNIEEGDGRPDIIMKSLQPQLRPHVIFELKQGEDVESEKVAALNQIIEKNYAVNLTGQVLCVGIAHNKKACSLAYKLITN